MNQRNLAGAMACASPILAPEALSPAACFAACQASHTCAGSNFTPENNCYLCGHASTWESLEAPIKKTSFAGCVHNTSSKTRLCIACPGPAGQQAIAAFMGLRIAGAVLALSTSCSYVAPAAPTDIFGASNPSKPLELAANMAIRGPGTLVNPIVIKGDNVSISGINIMESIRIEAKGTIISNVDAVPSSNALAAIKLVEQNAGSLKIKNTRGTMAIIGVGHGSGSVEISQCPFHNVVSVVLQELKGVSNKLVVTTDEQCGALKTVNLTALECIWKEYETRFFNDGKYGHTADRKIIYYFLTRCWRYLS